MDWELGREGSDAKHRTEAIRKTGQTGLNSPKELIPPTRVPSRFHTPIALLCRRRGCWCKTIIFPSRLCPVPDQEQALHMHSLSKVIHYIPYRSGFATFYNHLPFHVYHLLSAVLCRLTAGVIPALISFPRSVSEQ